MSHRREGEEREPLNHVLVDAVDGTKIYLPIGERFSLKDYVSRLDRDRKD